MLMLNGDIIPEGMAKNKSALLALHLKLSLPPSRNGQINSLLRSSNSVRHLSVPGCSTLQDDKSLSWGSYLGHKLSDLVRDNCHVNGGT